MRRVTMMIILLICIIGLTGCDNELKLQINTDLASRAVLNIEKVKALVDAGLLDSASGDLVIKDIEKRVKAIQEATDNLEQFKKYISWHMRGTATNQHGITFNTLLSEYMKLDETFNNINNISGNVSETVEPFNIIGGEHKAKLQEELNYKVMELEVSGNVALDDIVMLIGNAKAAKSSGDTNKIDAAFNALNQYFKYKGNKLISEPIISATSLGEIENKHIIIDKYVIDNIQTLSKDNTLGKDFRIKGVNEIPEIAVRLEEFNPVAIDKLLGIDGAAVDEYLVHNKSVYKMRYPINVIDSIALDSNDKTKYTATNKTTDYYINLITGEMTDINGYPLIQNGDQLIKIEGAGFQGDKGFSSFMLSGSKIVLRDYLEYTYMPGIVNDEKWVALGRRLRVEKLSGNMENVFASILDKDGFPATDIAKIYPTDLMSILSGSDVMDGYDGVASKLGTSDITETEDNADSETGLVTDEETDRALKANYSENIHPVMKLGCNLIATDDKDAGENGKMVLYGMCVDINPFSNGLYKSWIEGEETEFDNLGWWVAWLGSNRYSYKIDANALRQFLMENYSFEMIREGHIIINTEIISKIQKQYDLEDNENRVNSVRTAFVILGFILMAYALVLIASWAFDVNIVTGPRLMSTLTLNKWEAVQDSSELPQMEVADKLYMTFSKTLQSCMIIMALGFLLVIVDIVQVVTALIDIFGGVGDIIYKAIFGGKY
ncbi:hypothetical protein [Ruminiclostridium josui]|uniref:hypothetical protein n=1 Tax=Ruminiclostridium josui TaxID=1499 RepID=UPI000466B7F0|nr:hypothetical protein [Ruminiclostridium josui]